MNDVEQVVMREHTLAKVGEHVFYDGKEGVVVGLCHTFSGIPTLELVSVDDTNKTCIAKEDDCITMEDWWYGDAKSKSGIQY